LNEYQIVISDWAAPRMIAKVGRAVYIILTALKQSFSASSIGHSQKYLDGKIERLESGALEKSRLNQIHHCMTHLTANNKIR
jgi:hypothetical protein